MAGLHWWNWLVRDGQNGRFYSSANTRQYDPGLRAFYDRKRAEGKPHRVAVTAVARKLCHIVFAVMRDQVPYDPGRE